MISTIDIRDAFGGMADGAKDFVEIDSFRGSVALPNISFPPGSTHYRGSLRRSLHQELDLVSIQTASSLISELPSYSKLAPSLLSEFIRKEVAHQNVESFSQPVLIGFELGLINERLFNFVSVNARKLNTAIEENNDRLFELDSL